MGGELLSSSRLTRRSPLRTTAPLSLSSSLPSTSTSTASSAHTCSFARLPGDATKIRQALVFGSVVPLVMFVSWEGVTLSFFENFSKAADAVAPAMHVDPVTLLISESGNPLLGTLVASFSFMAIATSFLGVYCFPLSSGTVSLSLSLSDPHVRALLRSLVRHRHGRQRDHLLGGERGARRVGGSR